MDVEVRISKASQQCSISTQRRNNSGLSLTTICLNKDKTWSGDKTPSARSSLLVLQIPSKSQDMFRRADAACCSSCSVVASDKVALSIANLQRALKLTTVFRLAPIVEKEVED